MTSEQPWQKLLRDSLVSLSMPADGQIQANGPGCLTCDLLNDFELARDLALEEASEMNSEQRSLLDQIDQTMSQMQRPDFECFDDTAVQRPIWQQVRDLAAAALLAFGLEHSRCQEYLEVQPGIWRRPFAGDE